MHILWDYLAHRSMVFRLWLAVNVIFIGVAVLATAAYIWTSIEDDIDQARSDVGVRQESLRMFGSLASELGTRQPFAFTDRDFALLRDMGVQRFELFDPSGAAVIQVNPFERTVLASPGVIENLGPVNHSQTPAPALPPGLSIVPVIETAPVSADEIASTLANNESRQSIEITAEHGNLSAKSVGLSPWSVLKGASFGEETWFPAGPLAQRAYFRMPDLSGQAVAMLAKASFVMLIVFTATSAGCWLLLRHLIYKPLTEFSAIAIEIAAGHPRRLPDHGRHEMAGLARAFNGMADVLESKATIDSLTGLYNLRHLSDSLERLVMEARQTGAPLSLLVCDLDRFKPINDTYGHAAGDVVLRLIGETMRQWAAPEDVCWRLGGDEFAVALPGRTYAAALIEAARLQGLVDQLAVTVSDGVVRAAMSIGIATMPEDGDTSGALLGVADRRMYIAKDDRKRRSGGLAQRLSA